MFDISGPLDPTALTYLTQDLPGVAGLLKQRPEDFRVVEIPQHEPEGHGDHLYLYVEKKGRLTTDAARLLAQHFSVPVREVGYAGLKDKHAITRQWFSIEHAKAERAESFENPNITVLAADRSTHKLKRGMLLGNYFQIRMRGLEAGRAVHVSKILKRLVEQGVPNYFGEQRFGYRMDNHLQGRALLMGDWRGFLDQLLGKPTDGPDVNREARVLYERGAYAEALEAWRKVHRFERQALGPLTRGRTLENAVRSVDRAHRFLLISAFQSAIFNRILESRIREGAFASLRKGDVANPHGSRGVFIVDDPTAEQARCDAGEISATGPMWGFEMKRAEHEVGAFEREELLKTGVTEQMLIDGEYAPQGARRPLRMLIRDPKVTGGGDEFGPYVQVEFELDRGCYATVVMREVIKDTVVDQSIDGERSDQVTEGRAS